MKHRKAGKKLNRTGSHRTAMRRNMAASLFLHGKIVTTVAKAKDCRPFAERLITRARKGTLHDRRIIAAKLRHPEAERKLFQEIANQFRNRNGGYTSIHRLSKKRLGDAAPTAVLELVTWEAGEKPKAKKRKKSPPKAKPKGKAAKAKTPEKEETAEPEKEPAAKKGKKEEPEKPAEGKEA
ncbi:MAG: 50S ribosomal protein L17 [Planctomycetota bacterium]|jgi:large subunit ribosomal protein L17